VALLNGRLASNALGSRRGKQRCQISLRDDEYITTNTLGTIIKQEFDQEPSTFFAGVKQRFETLYYHPGYITPEEFFHRMFITIHALKVRGGGNKPTALFNSLDQLSARFPLCAKQEIFVPGIIETLTGEGITSIFIAVDEPGQPVERYGLLPMADLILSFEPHRFTFADYYGHLNEALKLDQVEEADYRNQVLAIRTASQGTSQDAIVLQVVRHAGGHAAGDKGILELIEDEKERQRSLYHREGLHFTRLTGKFRSGTPISAGAPTHNELADGHR
jgi:hypothetical protein